MATQPMTEVGEEKSMDFEVVIFNRQTGVSKKAGFTLSPKEFNNKEGREMKMLFARKSAESMAQLLNDSVLKELVKKSEQVSK